MLSVRKRIDFANAGVVPFSTLLISSLPAEQKTALQTCFDRLRANSYIEWLVQQEKVPSVYHVCPHGKEMEVDTTTLFSSEYATRLCRADAETDTKKNTGTLKSLLGFLAAAHDIIQDKGPVENEIQTYELILPWLESMRKEFIDAGIKARLTRAAKSSFRAGEIAEFVRLEGQLFDEQVLPALKQLAWEIIVNGTTFNFATQQPISVTINSVSTRFGRDRFPTVASEIESYMQLLIGIADTRRCSQASRLQAGYSRYMYLAQLEACGGLDNTFLYHVYETVGETSPTLYNSLLTYAHLAGQNVRAKVELIAKFIKSDSKLRIAAKMLRIPEDEVEASFRTEDGKRKLSSEIKGFVSFVQSGIRLGSIFSAEDLRESLNILATTTLEKYFDLFLGMMQSEVAFAASFSSSCIRSAWQQHASFFPVAQATVAPLNTGVASCSEWKSYSEILSDYLERARTYRDKSQKSDFLEGLVLLAGNQIGTFALRADSTYEYLLAERAINSRDAAGDSDPTQDLFTRSYTDFCAQLRKDRVLVTRCLSNLQPRVAGLPDTRERRAVSAAAAAGEPPVSARGILYASRGRLGSDGKIEFPSAASGGGALPIRSLLLPHDEASGSAVIASSRVDRAPRPLVSNILRRMGREDLRASILSCKSLLAATSQHQDVLKQLSIVVRTLFAHDISLGETERSGKVLGSISLYGPSKFGPELIFAKHLRRYFEPEITMTSFLCIPRRRVVFPGEHGSRMFDLACQLEANLRLQPCDLAGVDRSEIYSLIVQAFSGVKPSAKVNPTPPEGVIDEDAPAPTAAGGLLKLDTLADGADSPEFHCRGPRAAWVASAGKPGAAALGASRLGTYRGSTAESIAVASTPGSRAISSAAATERGISAELRISSSRASSSRMVMG